MQATFPQWQAQDFNQHIVQDLAQGRIANIDPLAIDLLKQCLRYVPGQRVSAKAALSHPYFADLDRASFGSEH